MGGVLMEDRSIEMQNALQYIESHLTDELEIAEIAKRVFVSPFYFQRVFAAQYGLCVGEYIRNRRLSLAGEELACTNAKVIDVAAKYGYDSPDSFTRAFQRFHEISPSMARKSGARLRSYPPMKLNQDLECGKMLEYKIVNKPQFTLVGMSRIFNSETSYQEIPQFWGEVMGADNCLLMGMYGVCLDSDEDGKNFEYLIADNYIPWEEVPENLTVKVIPASTWAVFPCRGPLPQALQEVNTRIWSEWLPNSKNYRLAMNMDIESYAPPAEKPEDTYSEIWLPVARILD